MAVTQNLKGTSYPSFKIHKQGPTFYQGTVAPNFVATNGDMYIQHGTGGAAWVYNEGWKILETGANDAVDVFEIYNSVRTSSKQVMYVLQGETTDATETELSPESTFSIDTTSLTLDSIGTTTDSGSSIGKISIPTNSTGLVEARIVARDSNNNSNAGYVIKGIIVNDRGTTTLLTDPAEEIIGEDTSEWYALVEAADNGSDSLKVKVSGSANARVRWTAFVTITLVTQEISLTVLDESGATYSVPQGETLLLSAASLLANDSSPGNTLSITEVQNPVGGTVTLNGTTIEFTSTGQAGQLASFQYVVSDGYGTQTGTVIITVTALNDVEAYMFNLQADADEARTLPEYIPPSVAEIFNTWARFDGANYYEGDDPNKSANASAWQLLTNPDRVLMPLNVDPTNGFVSPDSLDNYTFEATLTSPDSDNDTNGLIVAFVRENGINHVLALTVSKAGSSPRSGYGLMYFQNTSGYLDEPTILAEPNFGLDTAGDWAGAEIRLKIQRTGNIIKCYSTQFNDTSSYDANSEIIFDLSSNTNTQRFMGPKPYGYMTFSQPDSSYIDIVVNGGLDKEVIYDAENNQVWDWNQGNTAWELSTDTAQDRLSYVRQVTNPNTTERFRVRELEIEYLGKSENAVFDATRAATEIQNIYINSTTGGTGVGSGIEVIGLFEYDVEERNLLLNKPTLLTTSAYNNGNSVGSGTYFSDNNIDIDSLSLVDGTVVFADGTVGVITAITDSSISYTVTTDFIIFDETLPPTYSLSADNTTINEGDTVTFTLTTTNVADGTNIAYTVTGIDANDLSAGSLTGNITVNSNTGTAAFTLAEDATAEGQEVMTLTLDNGGDALDVVITDTSTTPAQAPTSIFSNATLAFTLDNPNVFSSAGDRFSNGNSVDMSGNYAIIGAYYEDTASTSQTGVAYIFDVTTGNLVHTLNNPSGTTAYFGGSVSISGNHAIVGGPFTSAAYIFDVTTGNLVHTISQVAGSTYFGQAVAISDNYAIVGARETDDSNGVDSGTAYIYDVTTGALLHTLNNPNEFGTVVKDNFGFSVAISDSYAVVGAKDEDDASGNDKSGVVYVFDVTTGNLVYTLINPGHPSGNGNNYFGHVVDLTDTHLLVSAYGAARVYLYSLSDGSLLHTIDNPNENTISSADFFGISAAIDGDHIVVGAIGEDTAEYNSVGVAYIFDVNTGSSVKTLHNPNAYDIPSDNFGDSVAISGEYIVVGSREDDETGNNSGKAYIFAGASGSGALSSGWVRTTSPIQGTLQSSTPIPRLFAVSVGDDGTIFAGGADVSGNKTTYAIAYDTDGGLAWGRRAGGNNSSYQDEFQDVATTGNDAIMVGNGYGHATYGPGIITKFQADGTTSWQKILYDTTNTSGSPNDDWWDTRGVVVGSDGSIYVCGQTRIGGLSYSENGLFITKLASDGTHTWTRVLEGGTGQEQQGGYKIAVDSNDNVFVCGTAHEDVSGNGYVSAFVAKLTSAGSMQWYRIYNDDGDTLGRHSEYATHIKVNSSDEIILSGFTNTDYVGQNYPFVAKLANSDGNIIWQRRSNHTDPGQGIALDNSDNIYQVCNNYQLNIWDNSGSLIGEWEFTSGNGSFYTRGITKDHNGNMIIVGHSFIGSTAGAIVIKLPATISAGTWGDFTIAATSKGDTAGALILDNHTSISNYTPSNITTSDANSNLTQGSVTITGGISETL